MSRKKIYFVAHTKKSLQNLRKSLIIEIEGLQPLEQAPIRPESGQSYITPT